MRVNIPTLFLILIVSISCTTYKVVQEKNERWLEAYSSKDRNFEQLHIFFKESMKGNKIYINHNMKVQFDGYLNNFKNYKALGICSYIIVNNSGSVDLKINKKLIYIETNTSAQYKYLIISQKSKHKYLLTYTNLINGGMYDINDLLKVVEN